MQEIKEPNLPVDVELGELVLPATGGCPRSFLI